MTSQERQVLREIVDLHKRLEVAERRIAYLNEERRRALERAEKATNEARYWHGLVLRLSPELGKRKRSKAAA